MRVVVRFAGLTARIAALVVTAGLLVATSAIPENCDTWAAPITFRAAGTCGPGGLIVVDRGSGDRRIAIHNAAAIGLSPLVVPNATVQALHQDFCPSHYDQGRWSVEFSSCGTGADSGATDAGGDAGTSPSDGAAAVGVPGCFRKCAAAQSPSGELLFTCTGPSGQTLCQSRLTVVE